MEPATAGAGRRQFARRRREQQQPPPQQQQQQQQQRRTRLSPVWNSNWNSDKRPWVRGSSNVAVVRPSRSSIETTKTRPASTCLHSRGMHSFSNPYVALLHGKEQANGAVGKRRSRMPVAPCPMALGRTYTAPPPPTASQAAKGRPSTKAGLIRKAAIKAKVESHLCSSSDHMAPLAMENKALAEAHQQLELLITGIERESYGRRRSTGARGQSGKGVRCQMGKPPTVPAGSPMLSARENAEQIRHLVPLACNPQLLPPARREALLKLLSRAEQHDNGIVELLRPPTGNSSRNRNNRLTMLQMLPLCLDESPYGKQMSQKYLCQPGGTGPRTDDERFKEAKILRSPTGQVLLSRTLEEELKDEQIVLNFMEEQLNERQQQAMRERAELEQHKQLVVECRERRRQSDLKKELTDMVIPRRMLAKVVPESEDEGHQISPSEMFNSVDEPLHELLERRHQFQVHAQAIAFPKTKDDTHSQDTPKCNQASHSLQQAVAKAADRADPLTELRDQRHLFQMHSQDCCLYRNARSSAPWEIFASVATTCIQELLDDVLAADSDKDDSEIESD
ncbi:uncharacterized protein LOC117590943 [Drosophila guanche]|uniref:Uncharacterized protein n=1 Tax=Drosophila guanche TaxID=7266 RepID=A0A3B0K5B8_DROGU|nr:uncharacterized protein LOC117590943 [Drosophila guanche]SPP89427.1 Hypothetical predicted protein [Drosophila guanche]